MKNSGIFLILIAIGAIAVGYLLYNPISKSTGKSNSTTATSSDSQTQLNADPALLNRDGAPLIGKTDAKVKLVLFSDYLCPYCKDLHERLNPILAAHPNDVSLTQRTFLIHEDAEILHRASEAANKQGKIKEMSDALFEGKAESNEDSVVKLAGDLGLDTAKFKTDLNSDEIKNIVANDTKVAEQIGLSGTPSIFINGKFVENPSQIEELINNALTS